MKNEIENARQPLVEAQQADASAPPAKPVSKPKRRLPGASTKGNGRHLVGENQNGAATAPRARRRLKPNDETPGAPSSQNGRHGFVEAQQDDATVPPAMGTLKPKVGVPGASSNGRQRAIETHNSLATVPPANPGVKPNEDMPGDLSAIVEAIRAHHRARRFAMGIQQVLDNKLAAYIRINETDWHPTDDESERAKANKKAAEIIKAAREGQGDLAVINIVEVTDQARAPADAERKKHEDSMEALAELLPVAAWVESVPGMGMLGLATIIAETGDLKMYSNVAKVWKRLGYAPYKGKAGSTWKRPKWRNADALSAEEWTENPFSGRRYALIHTISVWLKNKQWIGAAKTEDGVGKPNGPYGEVYAKRRARTAITHPDWSKQHAHMDGLRIMMKEVLKDLYLLWNGKQKYLDLVANPGTESKHAVRPAALGHGLVETHATNAEGHS